MSKKKVITIVFALILLISVIGATYAYFAINQSNTSSSLSVETGALKLVLEDGTDEHGVVSGEISPNNKTFTSYLSITNEGPIDTFARLYFKNLSNNFSSDLVYTIEEMNGSGTSAKSMKVLKYQAPVPSANNEDKIITDGLLIKTGGVDSNNKVIPHTQYYKVTIEYLYSDTKNQDIDLEKVFYTGFTLEEGEKVNESMAFINNIEDLVELAREVNSGDDKSGKEYRLLRSLDFNSDDSYLDPTTTKYGDINKNGVVESIKTELTTSAGWVPIGTESNPYSGDFNGNNYEIKNLYINNNDENLTNIGLFGYIINSTISNIGLSDINIINNKNITVGGLVATVNNSIIKKCYNLKSAVDDSIVNIKSTSIENSIGGLIGITDGGIVRLIDSYNESSISGGYVNGGIIGLVQNSTIVYINNSYNTGLLTTNGYKSGGLIGTSTYETNISIDNSHNIGNIIMTGTVGTRAGGIIGSNNSESLIIDNSFNNGIIENRILNNNNNFNVLGGLVGYTEKNVTITNSYNDGQILNSAYIGGIIGGASNSTIILNKVSNSSNGLLKSDVNTTQNMYVGGIIGGIFGTDYSTYILNSSNNALISVKNGNSSSYVRASGITTTGQSSPPQLYIYNSYNSGNISINSSNSDSISNASCGLLYNMSNKTIQLNNVYNSGELVSNKSKYALISDYIGNPSLVNSYYNSLYTASNISNIGIGMSLAQMQNASFAATLNNNLSSILLPNQLSGYTLSTWCISDNGPVLDFEVPESERSTRCPAYNN